MIDKINRMINTKDFDVEVTLHGIDLIIGDLLLEIPIEGDFVKKRAIAEELTQALNSLIDKE